MQLTARAPKYEFDMQRLQLLWAWDRKLSFDALSNLKAKDATRLKSLSLHHFIAPFGTLPKPYVPPPPLQVQERLPSISLMSVNDSADHPHSQIAL